ncbi:hypothetical protein ANAPC5_01412 [Anaplasma phagocytophilum]|nr:hypothetical protein ANAPC5_01412 [Anaplasma phagocytophilum]
MGPTRRYIDVAVRETGSRINQKTQNVECKKKEKRYVFVLFLGEAGSWLLNSGLSVAA